MSPAILPNKKSIDKCLLEIEVKVFKKEMARFIEFAKTAMNDLECLKYLENIKRRTKFENE